MKYDWVDFYGEMAEAFLKYKNNREALAKLVCDVYKETKNKIPTYGSAPKNSEHNSTGKNSDNYLTVGQVGIMDPFTPFIYLNVKDSDNRRKLCKKYAEKLNLKSPIPKNFIGIPKMPGFKQTMIWCGIRDISRPYGPENLRQDDIDRMDMLWNFYELCLDIKHGSIQYPNDDFVRYFNETKKYRDVAEAKISNVLFCIAPDIFMTVDAKSLAYIQSLDPVTFGNLKVDNGQSYSDFTIRLKEYTQISRNSFIDLSAQAYETIKSESHSRKSEKSEVDSSKKVDSNNTNKNAIIGYNAIYYGIPGCGKSFTIEHDVLKNTENVERIVFHPDYSYSDFVGQILPKMEDGQPKYVFVPGPFTRILHSAIANPEHAYYLVIEEVNRGNAPSIFGDVFQLLDRKDDGVSEYKIKNSDIAGFIYGDSRKNESIYIPNNLIIICTMNTADQNVFTLDTAFKRRWQMIYIHDEFADDEYSNTLKGAIIGEVDNTGNNTGVTWGHFHDCINDIIMKNRSLTTSEDKRLGSYFCTLEEVKDITRFTNKVIRYLYDDVSKTNKNIFEPDIVTFDDIAEALNNCKDNLSRFFDEIFKNGVLG